MTVIAPDVDRALEALAPHQFDALSSLDFACWEDAEDGGDGWARITPVAVLEKRSSSWIHRCLAQLKAKGLAERSPRTIPRGGRYFDYAPTELGAEVLVLADMDG